MSVTIHTPDQSNPGRPIHLSSVGRHPFNAHDQRVFSDGSPQARNHASQQALAQLEASIPTTGEMAKFRNFFMGMSMPDEVKGADFKETARQLNERMGVPNAIAKAFRDNPRHYQTVAPGIGGPKELPGRAEIAKSGALAKSVLDVGTQTNFANITGGQSLGYVSLDTRIARGTVRPDSYTLYQALPKSAAYQVVDYWAYIDDPGGPIPGAAYSGFGSVSSGTLATDVGVYDLQSVNLKLALNGRAVTTALMAQNSFVDVVAQENANAALAVLNTINWANYYGNPTLYPNMQAGLANTIPAANIFDFQAFNDSNAGVNGWSTPQALYNMIYECAANITSWGKFGRITHAFMTPVTNGSMQGLVTTTLNNIVNPFGRENRAMQGIIVDGDLQGMRTRMGMIQFPLDLFISARDVPAQAMVRADGSTYAFITSPTKPVSVTPALSGTASTGSNWGVHAGAYVASGGFGTARYAYAVASTDVNANESTLTWSAVTSGITATGAYSLTIVPPGDSTAINYRVYRTGLGGFAGSANSPTAVRYIGTIAANGSSNVVFVDQNSHIPGSETIFLLDMREEDFALDYRFLLPLTRVELFAQNLYMPWAVAAIGAIRNRIPKFHGIITNYVPDNPVWNPLAPNV